MSLFLGHVLSLKAPTKSVSSAYRIQDQNLSMASQCYGSGHQLFYLSRILSFEELFCLPFFEIPLTLSNITTTACAATTTIAGVQFSSVAQLCLTLWPHGMQHTRPPCPLPTPGIHSNSCPLSWWCHQDGTSQSSVWKEPRGCLNALELLQVVFGKNYLVISIVTMSITSWKNIL